MDHRGTRGALDLEFPSSAEERRARPEGATMRRRDGRRRLLWGGLVLAGLGLVSGCEVTDQRTATVPRIGFLAVGTRDGRAFVIDGLLQGLREHGYVEGQSIVIEYRFSEGRNDRLPELAAELVNLKVALIVASGSPASFAAKRATDTIPIVRGPARRTSRWSSPRSSTSSST
jgi:ABC-type uncharacterized transport system substrate-binding protein